MDYIREICKGIVIGVANIVPGVSGGTLAVSMGIYDKIIHAVTHLLKDTKKSILTLLPYGAGAILGVIGLSFLIEYLFDAYPFQTSMTFIGLIAGGLPALIRKVKGKGKSFAFLAAVLTFGLVLAVTAAAGNGRGMTAARDSLPFLNMFAVGMVAAATMVVPGVSGSMILMMMGYYELLIDTINRFVRAAVSMDMSRIGGLFWELFPFGLGVAAGIFLCAKLIEFLLARCETVTYYAIIGLVLSSPAVILGGLSWSSVQPHQILAGLSLAMISYAVAAG